MAEKPTYEELERRVQELEKAESEHNLAEDRLKKIFDNTQDAIFIHDLEGNILDVNDKMCRMYGLTKQEALQVNIEDVSSSKMSMKALLKRWQKVLNGEKLLFEWEARRPKDESVFNVEVSIQKISFHDKDIVLANIRDITERKKAQEALIESESLFRGMFNDHSAVMLLIDPHTGQIIKANKAAVQYYGYPLEKMLQMKIQRLNISSREQITEQMHSALNKQINVFEFRHLLADGQIRDVEVHSTPIKIQLQTLLLSIIHDTTESKQAKEVLAHQRKTYEQILDHSLAGYWDWDIPTGNEYLSPTFKKMFGYEDHEIENRAESWQKLIFAEDLPGVYEKFNQHVESKGEIPYYNEVRYHHKNGSTIWVICTGKVIEWEDDGKAKRMIGCHIDITDRKQAEEALKLNYALLQTAGETAIFGGWSVDLEKNICTWSDAVAAIHDMPHGYSPPVQEAINFYAPEWREMITQVFSACTKEGIPYDEEMEIITRKGKRVWVRTTGKAVKNEQDKIIKVQGSFQDITEQKRTVEALRKDRERMDQILRATQTNINTIDPEYNLRWVDATWQKIYGDPQGQKCYKYFMDLDKPCKECGVPKALATREIVVTEEFLPKENRHIEVHTIPFQDENGEWLVTEFNINITEHKQAEAEKEKLQAQFNQAQKMESVGRLAGGVAHDFNNMLGVILGHTELALLKTDEGNDLLSDLHEIQKAANRSADITKQLLAFARKQTIAPKQLDLNDTVESMLNMLRRLIGEDIDLVWRPATHLWPVKMDPTQIDQILANLCVNARDAISGVGKLTIETGRKTFDEEYCKEHAGFIPGDFVLLAVSDNGCGMDKDTLDNLFEPFFTTKEVDKGTGLGLATIYGIVKQNSGFINVYSEPGQGSTFKIYLPRLVTDEDIDMTVPEKKAATGGTETILLVEDEPMILDMTITMLEMLGYTGLAAASPDEALRLAKDHTGKVHLFMSDVVLPEMNGRDLAGKIVHLCPGIRLLFMSGYTANVIAHHGVLDDGVAFIQKPFSMEDMTAKVREVLDTASDETQ